MGRRPTLPITAVVVQVAAGLEVEAELDVVGARRHKVCAAEGRQEIIHRGLVGQIYGGEAQAPLVSVTLEKIVIAHGCIKQIPRFDARGVVVDVKSGARYVEQLCPGTNRISAADSPRTLRKRSC